MAIQSGTSGSDDRRIVPLFAVRREIALARLDAEILGVRPPHFDLDLAPAAVGRRIRRHVADAVLRADLRDDLLVGLLDLFHLAWKERFSAALTGDLGEPQLLLAAERAWLIREEPDRVHRDV